MNAAASAVKSLADAINVIGGLLSTVIRARADAKATIIVAKVRAELALAGLYPHKTTQAAEMQRVLTVNPDLPRDRRPADETLIKLHGTTRARAVSGKPGTSPNTPGKAGNPKGGGSKVVPIRSDP